MFGAHLIFVFCATLIVSISANKTNLTVLEWFDNPTENELPSLHLVHRDKKSYYIESILKANFFQAQQFCTYHGMHVLSITSQAENEFLKQQLKHLGVADQHFWTSGTRLPGGNRWVWMSTGRPVTYTNWHPGEPNSSKEACMEITISDRGLTWNDVVCENNLYFICEISWPRDCLSLLKKFNYTMDRDSEEQEK